MVNPPRRGGSRPSGREGGRLGDRCAEGAEAGRPHAAQAAKIINLPAFFGFLGFNHLFLLLLRFHWDLITLFFFFCFGSIGI